MSATCVNALRALSQNYASKRDRAVVLARLSRWSPRPTPRGSGDPFSKWLPPDPAGRLGPIHVM